MAIEIHKKIMNGTATDKEIKRYNSFAKSENDRGCINSTMRDNH
jgi:hypothetical protein